MTELSSGTSGVVLHEQLAKVVIDILRGQGWVVRIAMAMALRTMLKPPIGIRGRTVHNEAIEAHVDVPTHERHAAGACVVARHVMLVQVQHKPIQTILEIPLDLLADALRLR